VTSGNQQEPDPNGEQGRVKLRHAMASHFRDWVHESPMSQCNAGADVCPDWPLAYDLADLALAVLPESDQQAERGLREALERIADEAGRLELSSKMPTREDYLRFMELVYRSGDIARAALASTPPESEQEVKDE
jgi:hypothetical protein